MYKSLLYSALFFIWTGTAAFAMDGCGAGPCASCHSLTLKEASELLRTVGKVKKVEISPVNGLWLVELEKDGRQGVVFMDFGKKNLIAGTVFPLSKKDGATQPAMVAAGKGTVDVSSIPLEDSIVIGNPRGKKRLFVFTDPECPFCKKLHAELKKLVAMEPELAIYVKMFPLKIHPRAYDNARTILSARSPEVLDQAFAGLPLPVPEKEEDNKSVDETIKLAASLGIDATPTLVLPDGRVVAGYLDAEAIRKLLSSEK